MASQENIKRSFSYALGWEKKQFEVLNPKTMERGTIINMNYFTTGVRAPIWAVLQMRRLEVGQSIMLGPQITIKRIK